MEQKKEHKVCNICGKKNKTVKLWKALHNDGKYAMCDKCRQKTKVQVESEPMKDEI